MDTYEKLLLVKNILQLTRHKKVDNLRNRVLIKQMLATCFSDNVLKVTNGHVNLSSKEVLLVIEIKTICSK